MYDVYNNGTCPYFSNASVYNNNACPYCSTESLVEPDYTRQYGNGYIPFDYESGYGYRFDSQQEMSFQSVQGTGIELKDYGPEPFVVNINEVTTQNDSFRTALWTGKHLQLTLMNIDVGEDIGLEMHPDVDQFLRVEEGEGVVRMGTSRDNLEFQRNISDDFAILIPAGTWHNIINTGTIPLKLYSIYAPPQHPHGTVHETKADAEAAEANHNQ